MHIAVLERVIRKERWTTIIVTKKQTNHLKSIINQLEDFDFEAKKYDTDINRLFPTMIIDDEADYASQNTDRSGDGTTIWNDLVRLRSVIPRNCYVAYTATPQACLMASTEDPVGYPKDFWWMIEPYTDRNDSGVRRPRTYLGSWEVFWEYDMYLLHRMGRNEWPHHDFFTFCLPV